MLAIAPILALNHLLAGAGWARARLLPFAGRRARIMLPPFDWRLEISPEGYFDTTDDGEAEVGFTLPPGTPVLALGGIEAVIQAAHVSGPADFAEALGFVLRNLKWDAEEDLSRLVGDMAAHRLSGLARGFAAWQRQAGQNAAENVVEYLREEKGFLPRKEDIALWAAEVSRLEADTARLDARIRALAAAK